MNLDKILYWISTGIMLAIFAFSAWMYITNYEGVCKYFPQKGFPSWVVAPLAAAKILGIIAILTKKSRMLKEWAYAGFFFDAVLAFGAHFTTGDGVSPFATVAIIALIVSRIFDERLYGNSKNVAVEGVV